jgi:general secretion pathway protein D
MKKLIMLLFSIIFLFANKCDNRLFSLSTQGNSTIALKEIISNISDTCDLNIIFKDKAAKKVISDMKLDYLKLKSLTLNEFLSHILGENGFVWSIKSNTLNISYITTKNFKINYVNAIITDAGKLADTGYTENPNVTDKVPMQYYFWSDFKTNLDKFLKAQSNENYTMPEPIIDRLTGIVTVTGTKQQLSNVQKYIDNLNHRISREVFLDVKIYSVSLTKTNQTGINWSKFGVGMDTGTISTAGTPIGTTILQKPAFRLSGLLNFLSVYGQVNSISNPKITTLNNQEALIHVGSTINYSYKKQTTDKNGNIITSDVPGSSFVGILLDIIPQISDKNIVMMRVNPSISSIYNQTNTNPDQTFSDLKNDKGSSTTNKNLPPDTVNKQLNTIVRVKDGDTIILGGLITNEKTFRENGVPVLKEIPLVKYLFSYKSELSKRKELVFVITPHIINLDKKTSIKNAGFKLPKLKDL